MQIQLLRLFLEKKKLIFCLEAVAEKEVAELEGDSDFFAAVEIENSKIELKETLHLIFCLFNYFLFLSRLARGEQAFDRSERIFSLASIDREN